MYQVTPTWSLSRVFFPPADLSARTCAAPSNVSKLATSSRRISNANYSTRSTLYTGGGCMRSISRIPTWASLAGRLLFLTSAKVRNKIVIFFNFLALSKMQYSFTFYVFCFGHEFARPEAVLSIDNLTN